MALEPSVMFVTHTAEDKLTVRVAKYLVNTECQFEMLASGAFSFRVEVSETQLHCLLLPQDFDDGERIVIAVKYPHEVPVDRLDEVIHRINAFNGELLVGNLELKTEPEVVLQMRYYMESVVPISDEGIRQAILNAGQMAEAFFRELQPFLAEKADIVGSTMETEDVRAQMLH